MNILEMRILLVNKQSLTSYPISPNSTLIHPSFPLTENSMVILVAMISPKAKFVGLEK